MYGDAIADQSPWAENAIPFHTFCDESLSDEILNDVCACINDP